MPEVQIKTSLATRGPHVQNPAVPFRYADTVTDNGNVWVRAATSMSDGDEVLGSDTTWSLLAAKGLPGESTPVTDMVTAPVITGPSTGIIGETNSYSASGSQSLFFGSTGATIADYEWEVDEVASGNGNTFTVVVGGTNGGGFIVRCRAIDTEGNVSPWTTKTVVSSTNTPPDITGFVSDIPTTVNVGEIVTVHFSGVTDAQSDAITYDIASLVGATAVTVNDLIDSFTFTAVPGGATVSFTVVAKDARSASAAGIPLTAAINYPPLVSGVVVNLPSTLRKGVITPGTVSGIVDPEGETVTLQFTGVSGGTVDYSSGMAFTVTAGEGTTFSATVTAVDAKGGVSQPFVVSSHIDQVPDNTAMISSMPAVVNGGSNVVVTFSGALDPEGTAVTYKVVNVAGGLFSKLVGITAYENVTVTLNTTDLQLSFDVVAVDAGGLESTVKHVSAIINQAPAGAIQCSLPTNMLRGTGDDFNVWGATDPNGDGVTYNFTAITNCTLSKTTDVTAGELVAISALSGAQASFVVTSVDSRGKAGVAKTVTMVVNDAPVVSTLTLSLQTVLGYSGSYSASFSGGADTNGDTYTVKVKTNTGITPSKLVNIAIGETIQFGTPATGTTWSMNVVLVDSYGVESAQKTFSGVYNAVPDSSSISTVWPALVKGVEYTLTLTGGSDANDSFTTAVTAGANCTIVSGANTNTPRIKVGIASTQVSINAVLTDTFGASSMAKVLTASVAPVSPTGTITIPAGTSQTVTIPEGIAGTVLVDGNGGITDASTLTGDIELTLSGGLGVAVPSSTQEPFTLSPATSHSITATAAANGGSITIAW